MALRYVVAIIEVALAAEGNPLEVAEMAQMFRPVRYPAKRARQCWMLAYGGVEGFNDAFDVLKSNGFCNSLHISAS